MTIPSQHSTAHPHQQPATTLVSHIKGMRQVWGAPDCLGLPCAGLHTATVTCDPIGHIASPHNTPSRHCIPLAQPHLRTSRHTSRAYAEGGVPLAHPSLCRHTPTCDVCNPYDRCLAQNSAPLPNVGSMPSQPPIGWQHATLLTASSDRQVRHTSRANVEGWPASWLHRHPPAHVLCVTHTTAAWPTPHSP